MREKTYNIYFIFLFSIFLHLLIIFGIKNIQFKNNTLPNDNKLIIDLTSQTQQSDSQTVPLLQAPIKPYEKEENYKPIKLSNIAPPDISSEKIKQPPIKTNNLLKIPENIPFSIKVKAKSSKIHRTGNVSKLNANNKGKQGKKINRENLLKNYLALIRVKIKQNKKYPLIARKMEIEGATNVEFLLTKKGKLKKIDVIKSSGYKILDKAAVRAVKEAQPFPYIPENLKLSEIKVRLTIHFKLEE